MSEWFVAYNDFVEISRPLLALQGEPGEWLYPAEEIHALLAAAAAPVFEAMLVMDLGVDGGRMPALRPPGRVG